MKAAFFPVPDNECSNFNLMFILRREYQIHMGADRGRRSCVYKHTVHGYIPAAGDEIILTMDEIHPKIYRETHDYPSVACCHTVSPNDQFSWTS